MFDEYGFHDIHNAALHGNKLKLKRLLENGCDPNLETKNRLKTRPLSLAQDIPTASLLIASKADITLLNQSGGYALIPIIRPYHALHYQVRRSVQFLEFLLDHGLDSNTTNFCNRTALSLSVAFEDMEWVACLVENPKTVIREIDFLIATSHPEMLVLLEKSRKYSQYLC